MRGFELCAFADEADKRIDGQIAALQKNGISLLEIRGVDGENIAAITAEKAKEVKEKLDASGISVWSVGSPCGKADIDGDEEKELDRLKHCLELGNILGAKNIRMFSFFMPKGEADKYTDKVLRRLSRFCDTARGCGITLCHENEKGIYGDVAERCAIIHRALPEIRAVFDPANFVQCGEDTIKAWELLSPYVHYMHIKDALPDGSIVPAGTGIGNFPYLLERYTGKVLTLEPHLKLFDGLGALENGEKTKINEFAYASSGEAFTAAADALKLLIK